ncbi:Gx transporter family protein [bacterium]|nr:Gx transporter family protein [bacterium]
MPLHTETRPQKNKGGKKVGGNENHLNKRDGEKTITQSINGTIELSPRQRNLALLAGLSAALYTVENLIPLPIPWLRIGIGNVGVLLALYVLTPLDGFFVLLIKIIIGSLLSGRFLSPFFLFALGAGVPSYWIMAGMKKLLGRVFGPVGISVIGAVAHNLLQLAVAYFLLMNSLKLLYLIPVLVLIGTLSGLLVGSITKSTLRHMHINVDNSKA